MMTLINFLTGLQFLIFVKSGIFSAMNNYKMDEWKPNILQFAFSETQNGEREFSWNKINTKIVIVPFLGPIPPDTNVLFD